MNPRPLEHASPSKTRMVGVLLSSLAQTTTALGVRKRIKRVYPVRRSPWGANDGCFAVIKSLERNASEPPVSSNCHEAMANVAGSRRKHH